MLKRRSFALLVPGSALAAVAAGLVAAPPASAACSAGSYSGGDGSQANPFQIATAQDLSALQGDSTDWACHFQQTQDIDLTGFPWTTGIGNNTTRFMGSYDGSGFTISNLSINNTGLDGVGLFGEVGAAAPASSVTLSNIHVSGTVTSTSAFAGGLAGDIVNTTVENSSSSVNVSADYAVGSLVGYTQSGSVVRNSSASGRVDQTDTTLIAYAGGLIGHALVTTVEDSFASGPVVANSAQSTGGLVGYQQGGTIARSFATGAITANRSTSERVGGLVGFSQGTISDSFARGSIQMNGGRYIGGLVGLLGEGAASGSVVRSYSTGSISETGATFVGGLVGQILNGTVNSSFWDTETSDEATSTGGSGAQGKTSAELQSLLTYTDAAAGFDWNDGGAQRIANGYDTNYTWGICSAVNDGYPFLTAFYTSDPCSGGGGGVVSPSTAPAQYIFWFDTSDGGTCLDTVTVTHGQLYKLPPSDVACVPEGSELVGWSIPGQDANFSPSGVVRATGSQTFTAVARNPKIDVLYDANVNMADPCIVNDTNIEDETDRHETVQTPRIGTEATLATRAPCAPPGFDLIGWTDANTPDGSGQAQSGAQTYEPGAVVPDAWNIDGPNPVNRVRLYALWARSVN